MQTLWRPAAAASVPFFRRGVPSFIAIGLVSTAAFVVLYTVLRTAMPAAAANAIALLVTAIGNTAANRRFTFGVRGRRSLVRDHLAGLAAFAVGLGFTTAAIAGLASFVPHPARAVELVVLVGANGAATAVRFVLLRAWIAPNPERTAR